MRKDQDVFSSRVSRKPARDLCVVVCMKSCARTKMFFRLGCHASPSARKLVICVSSLAEIILLHGRLKQIAPAFMGRLGEFVVVVLIAILSYHVLKTL